MSNGCYSSNDVGRSSVVLKSRDFGLREMGCSGFVNTFQHSDLDRNAEEGDAVCERCIEDGDLANVLIAFEITFDIGTIDKFFDEGIDGKKGSSE